MKKLFLPVLMAYMILAGACTRENASTYESTPTAETVETTSNPTLSFKIFATQLPVLSLPFTANCSFTFTQAASIDTSTTHAYLKPFELPYKQLKINDQVTAVVALFPTDEILPRLRTFDPTGMLLDEQDLKFNPCRSEPGYDHREQFTIQSNKTITHIDSTFRWQYDDQYNEVAGTRKLVVTQKRFKINPNGAIVEVK